MKAVLNVLAVVWLVLLITGGITNNLTVWMYWLSVTFGVMILLCIDYKNDSVSSNDF